MCNFESRGFSNGALMAGIGTLQPVADRTAKAEDAPKPTPMITLTNDEVGWKIRTPDLPGPDVRML